MWRDLPDIDGINSRNVVSNLLKRSVEQRCFNRGLVADRELRLLYFPYGLVKLNKLYYRSYDGRKTYVLSVGQRTKSGSKYRYHLAPQFLVRRNLAHEYSVILKVRLRITDLGGKTFSRFSALARRKHLCVQWWNREWLNRQLAILEYLSGGNDAISIGQGDEEVQISASFTNYSADFSINEASLSAFKTEEEREYIEVEAAHMNDEESAND
ncbi:MAG: hypothetical protein L0I62_01785 [Gammaproteobacteria bacterium]|nr:hypothetical protein [Gammaproteobacteria bacterium]